LTGLWHGAAWNFVFWGLFFGVLLVMERMFLLNIIRRVPPLGYVYAMLSVLVGWVLFRSESLSQVKNFLKAMLGFHGTNPFSYLVQNNLVYLLPFMILAAVGATPLPKMAADALARSRFPKLLLDLGYAFLFALSVLFLVNESFNPFIYYRF